MRLLFWRPPKDDPIPAQVPLIVPGNDGAHYRLDEPADIDRMYFALSDRGQRSATARLWRERHRIT